MATETIILDDGEFYITLNPNYPAAIAPGFLQRRCGFGVATPGGYECVGSFDQDARDKWRAGVNAVYDEQTDSDSQDWEFFVRMDAIAKLWQTRHMALCRHR